MRILVKNARVMTMVEENQMINGDILIEDAIIKEIGQISPNEAYDEIIHADGMVAMPGLINTHNHSPMVLLRAFSDDLRLMEWLERKMLPAEEKMTEDDIYWGSLLAIAEMIKSGTTAFADMYISMDHIAKAVLDSGIRASLTRGLIFMDREADRRVQEGIELVHKWSGSGQGRITTMLGPHAPYTCPPEHFKKVLDIALELGVPIHTHLAETTEEFKIIQNKYGKTPAAYLHDLGLFDGELHVLLAHSVHLTDEDISLLRNLKGGIAHNPFSNLKLGCGIAPIPKYLEHGITVGLGTDGAGSATSLDLFKEMKIAAGLQKAAYFDPTVLDAKQVLRMATVEGAKLLDIHDEVGTLEPGKKADIILINMNQPHLVPQHHIPSLIAYSVHGADVDTTIVNGKILMKNRKLVTIDEDEVLREAHKRASRIVHGV